MDSLTGKMDHIIEEVMRKDSGMVTGNFIIQKIKVEAEGFGRMVCFRDKGNMLKRAGCINVFGVAESFQP